MVDEYIYQLHILGQHLRVTNKNNRSYNNPLSRKENLFNSIKKKLKRGGGK